MGDLTDVGITFTRGKWDPELMVAPAGWEEAESREGRPSSEAAGPRKRNGDGGLG